MFPSQKYGTERSNSARESSLAVTGIIPLNLQVNFKISFRVPPIKKFKENLDYLNSTIFTELLH